jgi:hypothetical protein
LLRCRRRDRWSCLGNMGNYQGDAAMTQKRSAREGR